VAKDYLAARVDGFEAIRSWFDDVDVKDHCRVCGLDTGAVREFTRLFATRKSALRSDLGILMGRHSTLNSYLELILLTLTGRMGTQGAMSFWVTSCPWDPIPRGRSQDMENRDHKYSLDHGGLSS